MFEIPVLLLVSLIMSIIQISIWQMFPLKLKEIMFCNPIFAFFVNLMGSSLIALFTGIASFVGICNLCASVIFGFYALWYKKRYGLKKLGLDWFKLWNFIPIFPRLIVIHEFNGKTWIL